MERTLREITEIIPTHPVAFDAALDAKIAGKGVDEQMQAGLDAYRESKGLPKVTVSKETPIELEDGEVIGDATVTPVNAPAQAQYEPPAAQEQTVPEVLYRRWALFRVRQNAKYVDWDLLDDYELEDVLCARGRRLDLQEWLSARFPE